MTELSTADLFAIIGEATVEIRTLRRLLSESMKRLSEKDELINDLQKQIGADHGEPT